MHKSLFVSLAFTLLGTVAVLSVAGQSREELQQKYISFLSENDIYSKIDEDGDIQFKYDEKSLYIEVNENDLSFFRLVCANIWSIESEAERAKVLAAIDLVNRDTKVVKMYTNHDNVWVSVEIFCATSDDYEAYFTRSLRVVMQGIDSFVDEMTK